VPDAASRLPARPSLEQLRKQAKDLLKRSSAATLAEAQLGLARQYGFDSWPRLVHHVEGVRSSNRLEQFERLGQDLAAAYAGDADALERLGTLYGISFSPQQLRMRTPAWPRWRSCPVYARSPSKARRRSRARAQRCFRPASA